MVAVTPTPKLKLKQTVPQQVKELLQLTIPFVDYSQGYQGKPRLRLRSSLMGASSVTTDKDRIISQSITELLSRTIVE